MGVSHTVEKKNFIEDKRIRGEDTVSSHHWFAKQLET